MNMEEWAKNEIEIACKDENPHECEHLIEMKKL